MAGNRMLQYIHQRLQQITGSRKLFGGTSILAVGDLFKLNPVFDGWIFENLKDDYRPLALNLWRDNFQVYNLNEIMRQKHSKEFPCILNRIRECKHTKEDIDVLRTRMIIKNEQSLEYPLLQPHIFLQNKDVQSFNLQIFELSKEEKYTNEAQDYIIGDVDEEIKLKVRKSIPTDTNKTMGLEKNLKLCKGMRSEISVNVDVEDGLSNGASGVLMGVTKFSKNNSGFDIIWIKYREKS